MSNIIIKEFKEVLILDCVTNFKTLNTKELKKVNQYLNPYFWYNAKNQSRNSFSKNKTKYYKLINKEDNHLKSQLEKIIFDKLEFLKEGAISTPKKYIKKGAYSNIYKGGICTLNENNIDKDKKPICVFTGLDISMQKEDSFLLSHTGLRYYHKNDKLKFEQIKKLHLSKVWFNSDLETQIKELAHNIRNKVSNQRIKQTKIYKPQQINFLNQLGI